MIRVTIEKPDAPKLAECWAELAPFATNAFMNPIPLGAAAEASDGEIVVLLAWNTGSGAEHLVGWWALGMKRVLAWRYLQAPAYDYAFLSTPVLHPDHGRSVVPAFLAAIRADPRLPRTIRLKDLDRDGVAFEALWAGNGARYELDRDDRPVASVSAGLKRSGSTRKKLRQDWNRLAALGTPSVVNYRDEAGVSHGLEQFLAMEQAGWKGQQGTALLASDRDARFARQFIVSMGATGAASVALLELDGRPIAAQVLLYAGRQAYTWKTSYDPDFAQFSPGTLLVDRISTDLIDSGACDAIDSCSAGGSFMASLWSAHKPIVDIMISAGPGPSPSFLAVTGYFVIRNLVRGLRDRLLRRRPSGHPRGAATGR